MKNLNQNCNLLGQMAPSATLVISAKAKEMKAQGIDVCSMSAGEPDFDTPLAIKNACINAINQGKVRYLASSGLPELKEEIIKKFANNGIITNKENIICKVALVSLKLHCGPTNPLALHNREEKNEETESTVILNVEM